VKYACIRAHQGEFPTSLMCRVLGVSRSGYYAAQQRGPSNQQASDAPLRVEIRAIHRASQARYGSPRVHAELQAQGVRCGRKRVERLMREEGLQAKKKRRFRGTTDSRHAHPIAPNHLARQFEVEGHAEIDRVWVSDITYVPTAQGWLYLSVVLDLKSRAVVGWAMKDSLDASLATDALTMALLRRSPPAGLLHHSDRGVQYACGDYREMLASRGITCSMSRTGNCWDNAVAESFFATLEWELIEESHWQTHEQARRALFEYLEIWYNRRRRHSTLAYKSPAEYEAQLALTRRAA
jgi:putative transposase